MRFPSVKSPTECYHNSHWQHSDSHMPPAIFDASMDSTFSAMRNSITVPKLNYMTDYHFDLHRADVGQIRCDSPFKWTQCNCPEPVLTGQIYYFSNCSTNSSAHPGNSQNYFGITKLLHSVQIFEYNLWLINPHNKMTRYMALERTS